MVLAEREGFEPSVPRKEDNGFRVLAPPSHRVPADVRAPCLLRLCALLRVYSSRLIPSYATRSGGNSGGKLIDTFQPHRKGNPIRFLRSKQVPYRRLVGDLQDHTWAARRSGLWRG